MSLALDAEREEKEADEAYRAAFRKAVMEFGGEDALRLALRRPESYLSKINEALAGKKPIQNAWRIPLLRDPRSAMVLLAHDSDVAGAEPPVFKREVSEDEIARAAVEVLAESGQLRETFRAQIAKRLGVRVEAVRL